MRADKPTNEPESAPEASYNINEKRNRKTPRKRAPRPGEGRPTKATPEIWEEICDLLADGLTELQACAYVRIAESTFNLWKQNPEFSEFRARAQACRILALQKRKREAMENKQDWKEAAWDLERIFKKQFAPATSETSLTLNQTNNTLNLTDGAALENARRALDEAKAIQDARRTREEARRQPIEAEPSDADLAAEPAPEPEPSPQSPTPTEPAERWRERGENKTRAAKQPLAIIQSGFQEE
jgi:hypothetical protein